MKKKNPILRITRLTTDKVGHRSYASVIHLYAPAPKPRVNRGSIGSSVGQSRVSRGSVEGRTRRRRVNWRRIEPLNPKPPLTSSGRVRRHQGVIERAHRARPLRLSRRRERHGQHPAGVRDDARGAHGGQRHGVAAQQPLGAVLLRVGERYEGGARRVTVRGLDGSRPGLDSMTDRWEASRLLFLLF